MYPNAPGSTCAANKRIDIYIYVHMILSRLFWCPDRSPKIESRNVVFAHAYAYASASASASDTGSASAPECA